MPLAHAFQVQVHLYNIAVPGEPVFEIYEGGYFEAILLL